MFTSMSQSPDLRRSYQARKRGGGGRAAPRINSIERLIDKRVVATNVHKRVLRMAFSKVSQALELQSQ
jgi:hypothetical protein